MGPSKDFSQEARTAEGRTGSEKNRPRKNSLDEMTIRRTEIPAGDRSRPHKPSLDHMGPGTDLEVPLGHEPPAKPRSVGGRAGSEAGRRGRRR
jgi:hypothetical protein